MRRPQRPAAAAAAAADSAKSGVNVNVSNWPYFTVWSSAERLCAAEFIKKKKDKFTENALSVWPTQNRNIIKRVFWNYYQDFEYSINCGTFKLQIKRLKNHQIGSGDTKQEPKKSVFQLKTHSHYKNKIEYFFLLTHLLTSNFSAPERHLIKLDFRNHFQLENSTDCKNDYLEVRDGKYGFNNIIKKRFCGSLFPPEIQSKDRHLWLHFHSDDTIEDKGFKAVYEFIPRSDIGEFYKLFNMHKVI